MTPTKPSRVAAAHAALRQAAVALADVEQVCQDHDPACDCPECGLLLAGELAGWSWSLRQILCSLESLVPLAVLRDSTLRLGRPEAP
jgi:hypothetical protein